MRGLDRTGWIAIILCFVGLIAWQYYYAKNQIPPPTPPPKEQMAAASATPSAIPTPAPAAAAPTPLQVESTEPSLAPRSESLGNQAAEFYFNNDTGGIEKVVLLKHIGEGSQSITLNESRQLPIGAVSFTRDSVEGGFDMQVDREQSRVIFTKKRADGLVIQKIFRLPRDTDGRHDFEVDLEITLRNEGAAEIPIGQYFVSAGRAAPIHESDMPLYTRFNWWRDGKLHNIDVNWFSESRIPLIGIRTRSARDLYEESATNISWASVSSQYFCTIVTVDGNRGNSVWARRYDIPPHNGGRPIHGIQGGIGMPGPSLAPGTSATQAFRIYSGPKDYRILKSLGQDQQAVLNFGFFKPVSIFLLWAMNSLNAFFHNYAISIIVLTLLIKTAMWPLQNKATESMKKMSALSPKMTELREKYKDNPQKMNEELMKLYREYQINPFSGCLPMLIQLPIFFGFYSMLGTAIELRNSSFLWVHDLSQPDTVFHILGFPINVLPLVMAGTMIWQMAISPKSGDVTQQRIMYFMPVIFIVFCYNFASALSLYWTTQNLFSIVQLYLTRNKPMPKLEKKSDVLRREMQAAKKKKKKRL